MYGFKPHDPVVAAAGLGQGPESFEEVIACHPGDWCLAPRLAQQLADGMKGEGQKIELKKRVGETVLAMAEVVLF